MNYYLDTCIWRDHYENRIGPNGRPLGNIASNLFIKLIKEKTNILYSNLIIRELNINYSENEIKELFNILFFTGNLIKVEITKYDVEEADILSKKRNVSFSDCLHAILARNNNCILITQNIKDFERLSDIVVSKRPEEV